MSDSASKSFPTHLPPKPPAGSLEKLKTKSAWWNFKASDIPRKDTAEFRKLHVNIEKPLADAPPTKTESQDLRISEKPAQNPFAEHISNQNAAKSQNRRNSVIKSEEPVSLSLKNLKASQERLNGAISQITMRLHDGSARDEKVLSCIKALANVVRQNMQTTSRIGNTAEENIQSTHGHLAKSASKIEAVFKRLEEHEESQLKAMKDLQSRSNSIHLFVAFSFTAIAIVLLIKL